MDDLDAQAPWTNFRFAVTDVEGNGQQPPDLVELAVILIEKEKLRAPSTWLVRPPRAITPMARRIHTISNGQVASAPPIAEVWHEMKAVFNDAVFVAHNAHVDLGVLARELPGFQPVHVIDTLKVARRLLPGRPSYSLTALAKDLALATGLPAELTPHRAAYDALVCARLLAFLASPPGMAPLSLADLLLNPEKTARKGHRNGSAEALF
jgi:exodeoxyribonuclease X